MANKQDTKQLERFYRWLMVNGLAVEGHNGKLLATNFLRGDKHE